MGETQIARRWLHCMSPRSKNRAVRSQPANRCRRSHARQARDRGRGVARECCARQKRPSLRLEHSPMHSRWRLPASSRQWDRVCAGPYIAIMHKNSRRNMRRDSRSRRLSRLGEVRSSAALNMTIMKEMYKGSEMRFDCQDWIGLLGRAWLTTRRERTIF